MVSIIMAKNNKSTTNTDKKDKPKKSKSQSRGVDAKVMDNGEASKGETTKKESAKSNIDDTNSGSKDLNDELHDRKLDKDNANDKPNKSNETSLGKKSDSKEAESRWDELAKPHPEIEVNWYTDNPDAKAASAQAIKRLENRRSQREARATNRPARRKSLLEQMANDRSKRQSQAKQKLVKRVEAGYRLKYSNRLKSSLAAKAMQIAHPKPNHKGGWFMVFLILLLLLVLVGAGKMLHDNLSTNKTTQKKPAQITTSTKQRTGEVTMNLDIPYNKTIGFVGDSLTYGCCQTATPAPTDEVKILGPAYRAINRGVNGSTTQDWQEKLLAPALDEFRKNHVEVAQIMLGTNDAAHTELSIEDSIRYYRNIIDRLERAGIKIIIINKIPFSPQHDNTRINQINLELNQLVDGEKVFLGDDKSYGYFRQHLELFTDGTHFTEQGYKELAKLWADGFKRVLVDSRRVKAELSTDNYKLKSATPMVYTVSKPSEWFIPSDGGYAGVYIDGHRLNYYDFVASGDNKQTIITINSNYLNGLKTGSHNIELRFVDGTSYESELKITDK